MNFYNKFSSKIRRYLLVAGVAMFMAVPGVVKCAGSVDVPNNSSSSSSVLNL